MRRLSFTHLHPYPSTIMPARGFPQITDLRFGKCLSLFIVRRYYYRAFFINSVFGINLPNSGRRPSFRTERSTLRGSTGRKAQGPLVRLQLRLGRIPEPGGFRSQPRLPYGRERNWEVADGSPYSDKDRDGTEPLHTDRGGRPLVRQSTCIRRRPSFRGGGR